MVVQPPIYRPQPKDFVLAMQAHWLRRDFYRALQHFASQAQYLLSQTQQHADFAVGYPALTRRHATDVQLLSGEILKHGSFSSDSPTDANLNDRLFALENKFATGEKIEDLQESFNAINTQFNSESSSWTKLEKSHFQNRLLILKRSLFPPKTKVTYCDTLQNVLLIAGVVGIIYYFGFRWRTA